MLYSLAVGTEGGSYHVEFYTTPQGESITDDWLDELQEGHRAKIFRWLHYLAQHGPHLPRPYADLVEGKIRELRIGIAHHEYRLLYFFHGKTIVVTHGFLKKTSRVPTAEIERAKRTMADWLKRYDHTGGG